MATKRTSPKSRRGVFKLTIGGKDIYSRMKLTTGTILGIQPVAAPIQHKNAVVRGAKGTKSFTLILTAKATAGGVTVKTIDIPVPGSVRLLNFYKWAKAHSKTSGMVSPDGISYYWKNDNSGGSGGSGGSGSGSGDGNPFGSGGALDGYGDDIGSAAGGALGSYLGGESGGDIGSNIGGALGGYLDDAAGA